MIDVTPPHPPTVLQTIQPATDASALSAPRHVSPETATSLD
jgi:hypothetical protein